jgi:RNA polymerase sigma-70 factor (ECF subfamily)
MKVAVETDVYDTKLMQQVAAGDGEAFRELFDRRGPLTLGVLIRIVRNRESAEEILQEVFLQVWRLAGSYRPEKAPPFAWILMLARSRAIDYLRSRQALLRREEAGLWQAAEAAPLSAEEIDGRILERRIRPALQKLPAVQRISLELAFFSGLSHSEIAERLATPLGTVKSRIKLGLQRLRMFLAEPENPAANTNRAPQQPAARPRPAAQAIPAAPPRLRDDLFSALEHLDQKFGLFSPAEPAAAIAAVAATAA